MSENIVRKMDDWKVVIEKLTFESWRLSYDLQIWPWRNPAIKERADSPEAKQSKARKKLVEILVSA